MLGQEILLQFHTSEEKRKKFSVTHISLSKRLTITSGKETKRKGKDKNKVTNYYQQHKL